MCSSCCRFTFVFLFCYEREFIFSLSDSNQADIFDQKYLTTLPQDI